MSKRITSRGFSCSFDNARSWVRPLTAAEPHFSAFAKAALCGLGKWAHTVHHVVNTAEAPNSTERTMLKYYLNWESVTLDIWGLRYFFQLNYNTQN